MSEFGFLELSTKIYTGSSIMSHKKNPDVLELIRANYHRVVCFQLQIKILTSNLISGYHRDFQLTKEPVINSFDITKESLDAMLIVLKNLKVNPDQCKKAMTRELFSTQEVYKYVKKGISFRDAYKKSSETYFS
jgi:argininosuccinate lyase